MTDMKALGRRIDEYRPEWQEFIRELVKIETPTMCAENIRKAARLISDRIRTLWDCEPEILDAGDFGCHVLARLGSTAPDARKILVVGHFDTVHPLGTLEKMSTVCSTQSTDERDGRMYGPGIYDMKTGVASMIYAGAAIKALGLAEKRQLVCMFNCDEERGSRTSKPYILKLAEECDAALIAEPSVDCVEQTDPDGYALKSSRSGIGGFRVRVYGKASHAGSAPQDGVNAVNELARQILKLADMNDYPNGISVNSVIVSGGGVNNVIPDYAEASVDLRIRYNRDREIADRILALKSVDPKARVEVTGGFGRPPMEPCDAAKQMADQARKIWTALGFTDELHDTHSGGGSDGNYTSRYIPTLDGLGAAGNGAHSQNEYIDVEESVRHLKLLAGMMAEV